MPERATLGLTLVLLGVVLLALGALVWSGALAWFGRLPGDIRVERPGMRLYAPITSMLIASLLLTAVWTVIRRFLR